MTGKPELNVAAFERAEKALKRYGYKVENPAKVVLPKGVEGTWENYMRADLPRMLKCDGLALLPGFINSRGAFLEITVAKALGIDAQEVDYWLMITPFLPKDQK
jgi:hypothetical protein